MARGGDRDITISLATDLTDFDARDAERDMDRLADATEDTGAALRDLGQDAGRAARDLGDVGDSADAAARDVDDATEEMKESGKGAAKELGASFTGSFEDIGGAAQGLVAELGASLGPSGMAAALAGAALIGVAMQGWTKETERAQAQLELLTDTLKNTSGSVPKASEMQSFVDALEPGVLARFADDAGKLGLSTDALIRAHMGEVDALQQVQAAQEAYYDEQGVLAEFNDTVAQKFGANSDSMLSSTEALSTETRNMIGTFQEANVEAALYGSAINQSALELEELATQVQETGATIATASDDFAQNLQRYPESIQATAQAAADATATLTDSWSDHISDVDTFADQLIAQQEEELAKLQAYNENIAAVYAKGGADAVAYAMETDSPADAAAALAKMSDSDVAEIGANYAEAGKLSGQALTAEVQAAIDRGTGPARKKAKEQGKAAGKAFADGWNEQVKANKMRTPVIPNLPPASGSWLNNKTTKVP